MKQGESNLQKLQQLEASLKLLLASHHSLATQLARAQQALAERSAQVASLKERLAHFQNQGKNDTIASYLKLNPDDRQAMAAKIDEYIREVEKCIAFLKD